MKKTPLQRKTPLRAKRRTLRRGQLNPREKLALRSFVYERDKDFASCVCIRIARRTGNCRSMGACS